MQPDKLTLQSAEPPDPQKEDSDRSTRSWQAAVSLLLLLLAGFCFLLAGSLLYRQAYLTRGIPEALPEPIAQAGSALGINVYLQDASQEELESALQQISALGIKTIKQPFYFSEEFDWQSTDRLLSGAADHNLTLVPLLDGNPEQQFAPPADTAVFAAWAGEFAARYGNDIRHYIIWDEPNLSSHWGGRPVNANEYGALLSAAAGAIRAADADAVIIAAPLAPTEETGPQNLSETLFLQELYEAGAAGYFDAVAAKPYGFSYAPDDRKVDQGRLNFSRVIALRETMESFGDAQKAIWAGNWGWNSLPDQWSGAPSIWGQVTEKEQAAWTVEGLERARREWPWMGLMFLENWQPAAAPDDARWGFSIAGRAVARAIETYLLQIDPGVAYPGFHLAQDDDPAQQYEGGWRFSPQYGADISQPEEGQAADRLTFTFWGTDAGLRVRRADFRARLYVTVDGQPANALPRDENGAALVLTSPDPTEDNVITIPVAKNLNPGVHTMEVIASRGWDQWALNGFSVGYSPFGPQARGRVIALVIGGIFLLGLGIYLARQAEWGTVGQRFAAKYNAIDDSIQLALTALAALIVALTGWLTWGEQLAGMYRRLGDGGQLALTAAAASFFYITPSFFIFILALALLFVLIYLRPAWGLALVAFTFPFYVPQVTKPIFNYRFSPVELFMLLTFGAFALRCLLDWANRRAGGEATPGSGRPWHRADYAVLVFTIVATISLFFTERLGVATNEWRLVVIEPALFYLVIRALKPQENEMWVILDAFVLGGLVVALIGLWQYVTGQNLITAEAGLMRLRSIYGSPNNVALYLGRMMPLLAAMALLGGATPRRRWAYTLAILPIGLAFLLTFSRGGLLLGLPAGLLVVFWIWQRRRGRSAWPWVLAVILLAALVLLLLSQVPQLAGRFDLGGTTGVFRVNLWRSSLEMIRENPLFGVGLDNFLYAYRGRYILDGAWQEPNLNHPHNIFLDFATRLGIAGLLAGLWLFYALARTLYSDLKTTPQRWLPVVAGFSGGLATIVFHGLVDHSFFLVDLAFSFYLMMGTAVWLDNLFNAPKITGQS
ncbi:MAG: O-antigen ligase family protein [Candidatus Promineifilaceae bacterium]